VEMWLRLIHGHTWAYDPVATAVHATQRPGGITQSGRAESQYYVMRGFLKNRERYRDALGFEKILQNTAHETISAAVLFGKRDDVQRIREIAWPLLRTTDRLVFNTLGRFPGVYRAVRDTHLRLKSVLTAKWPPTNGCNSDDQVLPIPSPNVPDLFDATVVIVTKNRKDELRRAVASAIEQRGRIEVLVIDDGSTDGTAEMVREEFPTARLNRVEESRGYIVNRNRAVQLARAPILVSIDDDAAFSTPTSVQQILTEFSHPRVGVVAVPSIDLNRPGSPLYRKGPPDQDSIWVVDTFRGTAYAARRDVFMALGGYREKFFHQSEEQEYALRMLDRGYVTRLGSTDPIHHFESPRRDRTRIVLYSTRNAILFTWYNVPMPYFLVHMPAVLFNSIVRCIRIGWVAATFQGTAAGIRAVVEERRRRRPVSGRTYRLSRQLRKSNIMRLEDIEPFLSPIAPEVSQLESAVAVN
jgi:glycosyltransferase involved in cell wall biosynthesis